MRLTMLATLAAGVVGLGLTSACKQETKAPPPAEPVAAGSQPGTAASAAAGSMPAGHGKIEAGPAGAPFSGLVKLADGIPADSVKPTDVLFVMARESQGGGLAGRLIAVQRFSPVELPKAYELGPGNVMVPGIPFSGPFIVTARLDRDGDPMTRGDDDLYATVAEPVKAGTEGNHLVLKKGMKEPVPAPPGAKAPPAPPVAAPVRPASQPN